MTIELKPCPFCGGRADFNEHDAVCYFTKLGDVKTARGSADLGPMLELRDAWNRRAELADAQAEIARLRGALERLADCAQRCDSWESFPQDELDAAYAAICK